MAVEALEVTDDELEATDPGHITNGITEHSHRIFDELGLGPVLLSKSLLVLTLAEDEGLRGKGLPTEIDEVLNPNHILHLYADTGDTSLTVGDTIDIAGLRGMKLSSVLQGQAEL